MLNGHSDQEEKTADVREKSEGDTCCIIHFLHFTFVPLCLMIITPNFSVLLAGYIVLYHSDYQLVCDDGFLKFYNNCWREAGVGDWVVSFLLVFTVYGLLSQVALGGKEYTGPTTKSGHVPKYRHSGFRYFLLTAIIMAFLIGFNAFSAWRWYNRIPKFTGALNLYGLVFCLLLYLKGRLWPSPGESGMSGNFIFDYYWGLELYPRIFWDRIDIKMATNNRFGMMLWALVVWMCWKAQVEHSGWNWAMAASAILQTFYIGKFYWWEDGYMNSIDIIVDRAGYYICWGCIVFVPIFYTSTSIYLTERCPSLPLWAFVLILAAGLTLVGLNYWSDQQRRLVRKTNGNCTIWCCKPNIIVAAYQNQDGDKKESILLASGFWGLSRHINYMFEILSAFLWELPSLFFSIVPYMYVIFLTVLLVHRSHRDDLKCRKKYGKHWDEYCKVSQYKIIPYVF